MPDVWQVDYSTWVPDLTLPTARYYWTTTSYWRKSDRVTAFAALQAALDLDFHTKTADVRESLWQVKSEPGRGNIVLTGDAMDNLGGLTPGTGGYNLLIAGRIRLLAADGRPSYRLQRTPIYESDLDGDTWSSTGKARINGIASRMLFGTELCDSRGQYYIGAEVASRPCMWQQRHGTKRRERNPLA